MVRFEVFIADALIGVRVISWDAFSASIIVFGTIKHVKQKERLPPEDKA